MGLVWKGVKGVAKATGAISGKAIDGLGNAAIGLVTGTVKGAPALGKALTKNMTAEELADASIYEKLLGKKLNAGGLGLLTAGTMAVSTIGAISNNGLSKAQKVGHVSVGDNLDRLVSYDGSGFVQNINRVSKGNPAVMQDIVENTFDNPNQFGVSGDIVFALHNMREG